MIMYVIPTKGKFTIIGLQIFVWIGITFRSLLVIPLKKGVQLFWIKSFQLKKDDKTRLSHFVNNG